MGFGGGAMVGAPLAVWLMRYFTSNGVPGVATTLMVMGDLFRRHVGGCVRLPRGADWLGPGQLDAAAAAGNAMITPHHVHLDRAWRTPQFWLIWGVLCTNVTAGIGVISMASPMLQDVFGARLLGIDSITTLTPAQKAAIVAAAAGLVGLISLFNSLGRIFWASLSDKLGRKNTYYTFFVLGMVLYCLLPTWGILALPPCSCCRSASS